MLPLAGLLLCAAPLFEDARRPLQHVTPPPGLTLSSSSCEKCHSSATHAWRASGHARSWTSPVFQAGFQRSKQTWCVNCHAPLPSQALTEKDGALRDEGVACAACHVRDGAVLTASAPTPAAQRAHRSVEEPRLRTSELCAGCHQFNFPKVGREGEAYSQHPMQNTVTEWKGSSFSAQACQSCHEHGLKGSHDASQLAAAVDVATTFEHSQLVRATVRTRGVGHRLPTGDLFRKLELQLCADAECSDVLGSYAFERTYRLDGDSWRVDRDTTLPEPLRGYTAERSVLVSLARPVKQVFWRLRYAYDERDTEPAVSWSGGAQ